MSLSTRILRPRKPPSPSTAADSAATIQILPFGSKLPHISSDDLLLLRQKQSQLPLAYQRILSNLGPGPAAPLLAAINATLIFAQPDAGTAVCVAASGWLLTCSHCIGESPKEWKANRRKWLLFPGGIAVLAECRAWDGRKDVALLRIVAVESSISPTDKVEDFRYVELPEKSVDGKPETGNQPGGRFWCIGQPGSEDLEYQGTAGRKTGYDILSVSEGRLRGIAEGADPADNSQIGTLMHDAWTYWGHSGAPLVRKVDGRLLGLHSSWDEVTGMRRGVGLKALWEFWEEWGSLMDFKERGVEEGGMTEDG